MWAVPWRPETFQRLSPVTRWTALMVGFNGMLAIWLVSRWGGGSTVSAVDNVAQFVGPLLVLPLCFSPLSPLWRRRRSAPEGAPREWIVPAFLGAATLFFALGQIVWAWYELILHQDTPFPSLADVGFLLSYPFLTAAVLLFPARRLSPAVLLRVVLDGVIVLAALVTLSWYFILGPTVMQGGESVLGRVVGTAYPMWDIILIACLVVMYPYLSAGKRLPAASLLALGMLFMVVTDAVFDYGTLHGTYATGDLIDVGWPMAYMTIGLAAQRYRMAQRFQAGAKRNRSEPRSRTWAALLPYALVPPVVVLWVYINHTANDAALKLGVEAGSIALVACILLRQVASIAENGRLYSHLRQKNLELQEANLQLEALATTDPHTGLPNHRSVIAILDRELERAYRYRRPCSLLFLDVDHFKTVNDGLGHSAGDAALSEFAAVVRDELRGIDALGRWGGEEFIAILPEASAEEAEIVAERLRAAVAIHTFAVGGGVRLTCSIGHATFPDDAHHRDGLVDLADQAMYAAKRLGRNQVRSICDPAAGAFGTPSSQGSREDTSLVGIVEALCALVDARDQYTGRHAANVSNLSVRIALAMGRGANEAHMIGLCGRVHDVGKVAVPDAILRKPARLSVDEWELIRRHSVVGSDVLARIPAMSALSPIVRGHHERWDGSGYPDGLRGDAIPLGARIIAVADAYSAMTTERPYRGALSAEDALLELERCAGSQFDLEVVAAAITVLRAYEPALRLEAS